MNLDDTSALPAEILTVPYSYHETFDTGEVNGWDSYPPAQDTAFDPTFGCVRQTSGFALQKAVRPIQKGPLELGFIKKLAFLAGPETTLSFKLTLETAAAHRVEIALCASNGQLLSIHCPSVSAAGRDFGIQKPTKIQAIFFRARLTDADSEQTHRLILDNVELRAERPARVRVLSPPSTRYPDWDLIHLNRHYRAGDALNLKIHIPFDRSPAPMSVTLDAPDGTFRKKETDTLSDSPLYVFRKDDPPGLWQVRLTMDDRHGRPTETIIHVFLVQADTPLRPRVLLTPQRQERLRAAARTTKKPAWDDLRQHAAALRQGFTMPPYSQIKTMDPAQLLPTFATYASKLRSVADYIALQSLVYAIDHDLNAGQAARKALLAICSWDSWAHPWIPAHGQHTYWPAGILSGEVASGYDLIHPLLTEEERRIIRRALMEKAIIPAYREFVLADRIPFDTSNWIGIILGGAIASAMTMYGEEDVEPYLTGMLVKLQRHLRATFRPEGGYGEGIGYQCFNLLHLSPALSALEHTAGIDIATIHAMDRTHESILYSLVSPQKGLIAFGDSRPSALALGHPAFAWLAHKFSGHSDIDRLYQSFAGADRHAFIYLPDRRQDATRPTARPPSRSFPDLGLAFMRSGWEEEAHILTFKCGPFYNHHHLDQGSFQMWAYGEELLTEAGLTDYYADPNYASFYIQPAGHNTLLVDANPQSQRAGDFHSEIQALRAYASITQSWNTPSIESVEGNLQPVYSDDLQQFTRTITFLKPDYFVLLDRVKTRDAPRRLDWLFHVPSLDGVKLESNAFHVTRPHANLEFRYASTDALLQSIETSPPPLNHPGEHPVKGFVRLHTEAKVNKAVFLAVMAPRPSAARRLPEFRELKAPGALGWEAKAARYTDTFWVNTEETGRTQDMGIMTTDAEAWWLRADPAGKPRTLMIQSARTCRPTDRGTFLTDRILASERSISLIMNYRDHELMIDYTADSRHQFTIAIPHAPGTVKTDGRFESGMTFDKGRGELSLETIPGSHRIEIRYER